MDQHLRESHRTQSVACQQIARSCGALGVCMLTTRFEGGLRARPLEPRPDKGEGLIWFVTDLRSGKEHEIEG